MGVLCSGRRRSSLAACYRSDETLTQSRTCWNADHESCQCLIHRMSPINTDTLAHVIV